MEPFEELFGSEEQETTEEIVEETTTEEVEKVVETTEEEVAETEEEVEQQKPEKVEVAEDDEKHSAPMAALTAERTKRQDAERELADLKAQKAAWEAQQKPQEQATSYDENSQNNPDPFDDPEGFRKAVEERARQEAQAQVFNYRLHDSYQRQVDAVGADKVEEAKNWAMQFGELNPTFEMQFYQQADPMAWVVQEHQRHTQRTQWEADPKAWALKYIEEQGLLQTEAETTAQVQKQEAPKKAPKSITSVAAANTRSNARKGDFLDDIFG